MEYFDQFLYVLFWGIFQPYLPVYAIISQVEIRRGGNTTIYAIVR